MSRRPFVFHFISTSLGGGAHQIAQLVQQPCFRDYRIAVMIPEDGDERVISEMADSGAELITMGSKRRFSLPHMARLPRILKQLSPDIFHLHGLRAAAPGRLATLAVSRRPKIVYTIHGFHVRHYPPFRRHLGLFGERLLAPLTDRFICPSAADSKALTDFGVAKAAKVSTVLNGVDLRPIASQVSDEFGLNGKKVITSVCRLHPPKDPGTLIDAFSLVPTRFPDSVLLFVGDGPFRPSLEKQVAAKGLEGRVIFTGLRPDVESFLRVTDVFCLSSQWEGGSLAVIEAMAAGLPIVASDIEGIRETVIDGETGLLVPSGDAASLGDALSRCLGDPVLRDRLALAGQERYKKIFTAGRMAAETEAIYRELLDSGFGSRGPRA